MGYSFQKFYIVSRTCITKPKYLFGAHLDKVVYINLNGSDATTEFPNEQYLVFLHNCLKKICERKHYLGINHIQTPMGASNVFLNKK